MLPLLWLSVVVVAPVTEECSSAASCIRLGLSCSPAAAPSWLGVSGTIVVTSALWAVLHQQYNVLGILFIFVMGLIFGWMRQRSGSTLLPMVLHTAQQPAGDGRSSRHPGRVAELNGGIRSW